MSDTYINLTELGRFRTNLLQYDVYNRTQIDSKFAAIKNDSYKKVNTTTYPTLASFLASTGEEGYMYLYPVNTSESPTYASGFYRYIWEDSAWLPMGTTVISMSGYATETWVTNNFVAKVTGKGLSTNDFTDAYVSAVNSNTSARHSHSNKTVLDATTASFTTALKSDLDSNTSARHSHSNKALLDTYTQTNANIKSAVDNTHTHSNKALLDTYTQTEANLADAVSKKHSHSNKSVLDATTASYTTTDANHLSTAYNFWYTHQDVGEHAKTGWVLWDPGTGEPVKLNDPDNGENVDLSFLRSTFVFQVSGMGLSKNDFTDAYKSAVDSNTSARHSHSNKALLDTYTQTEVNLADAVSKRHSHSNKALLDTYTQTETNLADAVSKKHSHSNATVLNNTTASFTTALKTKLDNCNESARVRWVYYEDAQGESIKLNDSNDDVDLSFFKTTFVAQVSGKGLSTNDFTNTYKGLLDPFVGTGKDIAGKDWVDGNYVAKVSGKGLSTNDYTTNEKNIVAAAITGIKRNGTALTPTNHVVDISVPDLVAATDAQIDALFN